MTIEVQLPDGRVLEFPEGTDQETMRAAVQRLLGEPTSAPVAAPAEPQADMSFTGRLKDNFIGVDDGVLSGGEKLAGFLNLGGEGLSMGLVGDEATAAARTALGGNSYESNLARERAREAQLREENPYLSLVAELGGSMVLPGAAIKTGTGVLGRSVLGGLTAGAGAGTYGFMEGEDGFENRRDSALLAGAVGGSLGSAVPVVGSGIGRAVDRLRGSAAIRRAARNAPTPDELESTASALFREVDQGALPQDGVIALSRRIAEDGRAAGMDSVLTPNATRAASNLADMADSAGFSNGVPMSEMNIMRRQAGVAAGNIGNRTESAVGTRMVNAIDDYVDEAAPALGEKAAEARRMWGVLRRSELIDQAFERAGTAASGFENGLQQEFRRILRSPALSRGFSAAEKQAMRSVVNGGALHGLLRQVGRFGIDFGGGQNALGAGLGLTAGLWAPIIPVAATGARKLSEMARTRKANQAAAIVRTLDMPNLPQISQQGRGLLEDILLRSSRSAGIAAAP